MNNSLKIYDPQIKGLAALAAPLTWCQHGGRVAEGMDLLMRLMHLAVLLPVFAGTYYLSYWLRFEGQLGVDALERVRATVAWVIAIKTAWFVGLGACRVRSRPATFYDLIVLTRAATAALVTLLLLLPYSSGRLPLSRSILLLDWGATIVVVGGALRDACGTSTKPACPAFGRRRTTCEPSS